MTIFFLSGLLHSTVFGLGPTTEEMDFTISGEPFNPATQFRTPPLPLDAPDDDAILDGIKQQIKKELGLS